MKSSGGQVEKAIVPPGFSTRTISPIATSERVRVERQLFDIAFVPVDLGGGRLRVVTRGLEQFRRQVEAGGAGAQPGGGDRHDARSACDVEHVLTRADARVADKARRGECGERLLRPEMLPSRFLGGFEIRKRIHGREV